MKRERYVILFRRWHDREKCWTTTFATTEDRPNRHPNTLGAWQVERVSSASAALGAVAEYLMLGRPRYMTVRELWSQTRRDCDAVSDLQ